MDFQLLSYTPELRELWDETASRCRQNSFLFRRDFMDYHRDRFPDRSVVIVDKKGRGVGLFPACTVGDNATQVVSHGGLTYGGLLLTPEVGAFTAGMLFTVLLLHYHDAGFETLLVKPVPSIYHTAPAEEEIYWLFRNDAQLVSCGVSSAIDLTAPLPFSTLRRRKVRRSEARGTFSLSSDLRHLPAFWNMLSEGLWKHHAKRPVHSLEELSLLTERFPEEIRLFCVCDGPDDASAVPVAGTLLFFTRNVIHAQYIASSDEGRDGAALDFLFDRLLHTDAGHFPPSARFFDFGISTEGDGSFLNEGLVFQKEGFGARTVCYEQFLLSLKKATESLVEG
ncbi:MAG: GNAT family N-acetyltransferase [Alloprevotella sp.]